MRAQKLVIKIEKLGQIPARTKKFPRLVLFFILSRAKMLLKHSYKYVIFITSLEILGLKSPEIDIEEILGLRPEMIYFMDVYDIYFRQSRMISTT